MEKDEDYEINSEGIPSVVLESNFMSTDKKTLSTLEKVKSELKIMHSDELELQIIENIEKIGYDLEFMERGLKVCNNEICFVVDAISIIVECRAKFYRFPTLISSEFVNSSINDGFCYISGKNKKGCPTLILKTSLNVPGKQSLEERVSYIFFILEQALEKCKSNGVDKICVLYDRKDFDQEKHFDKRLPKALKSYMNENLFNILINLVDQIYVVNLSIIYKMMFEMYKLFAKKNKALEKVNILSSYSGLKDYWDKNELPDEYKS